MKCPCEENFVSAMVKEINNYTNRKHWKHCSKLETPTSLVLQSIHACNIKRNRLTRDTIKLKVRFCVDGQTQELGINFNDD